MDCVFRLYGQQLRVTICLILIVANALANPSSKPNPRPHFQRETSSEISAKITSSTEINIGTHEISSLQNPDENISQGSSTTEKPASTTTKPPPISDIKDGSVSKIGGLLPFQVAVHVSSGVNSSFTSHGSTNKNLLVGSNHGSSKLCVGVILEPKIVLVAQSCIMRLDGKLAENVRVSFKSAANFSVLIKGSVFANTDFSVTKNQNMRYFHDYALINLEKPLSFNDNLRPISIPKGDMMKKKNLNCKFLEFDLEKFNGSDDPRRNLNVELDFGKKCDCKEDIPENAEIFCTNIISTSSQYKPTTPKPQTTIKPTAKVKPAPASTGQTGTWVTVYKPTESPWKHYFPKVTHEKVDWGRWGRFRRESHSGDLARPLKLNSSSPSSQNGLLVCPRKDSSYPLGERWFILGVYSYSCNSHAYYTNLLGEIDKLKHLIARFKSKNE